MSYFTNVEANDNIIDYFLLPTVEMTQKKVFGK
jgi:hypothetical protein